MNKQETVCDFLITPISEYRELRYVSNSIGTTQRYHSGFDPDMSDIAIEFYKIIYNIDELLDENGYLLFDKQLAGDTMCSFNTIANKVPKAGKSRKKRTSFDEWPEFLKDYHNLYHCLANFWLLPLWVGRSYPRMPSEYRWGSKTKRGIDDYMDCYLSFLKEGHYSEFIGQYVQYGKMYASFDEFCDKHYLTGKNCYIRNGEIFMYSHEDNSEEIVRSMTNLIKARAEQISKDEKVCDKLYDLRERLIKRV